MVREDEVAVIQGKGKTWITNEKKNLKIEAWDYIYVPKIISVVFLLVKDW